MGLARTMIVRLARHQRVWTSMLSTAFVVLFPQKRKPIKSVSAGLDEHAEHSVGSSSCHQRPRGVMRHLSSIYAYAYMGVAPHTCPYIYIWVMRHLSSIYAYASCLHVYTHACAYMCMCAYVYHTHTCTYHVCVCMDVRMYECMHACMYVFI